MVRKRVRLDKSLPLKRSEVTRTKMSESQKGRIMSEESKRKMSESHKGSIPWNKGRTGVYSEETKRKMSEARKGMTMSEKIKELEKRIDEFEEDKTKSEV